MFSDAVAAVNSYMPEDVRILAVKAYSKNATVIKIDSDLKYAIIGIRPNLVIEKTVFKDAKNSEAVFFKHRAEK